MEVQDWSRTYLCHMFKSMVYRVIGTTNEFDVASMYCRCIAGARVKLKKRQCQWYKSQWLLVPAAEITDEIQSRVYKDLMK